MKALLSVFLASLCFGTAQCQWTIPGTNINNTNTGNVGIGTTTPSSKLHVITASGTMAQFQITSSVNSWISVANTVGGVNLGVGELNPHPYLWSSTGKFFIGNDGNNPTLFFDGMGGGNVGIGTITPRVKLDLNGLFYLNRPSIMQDIGSTIGIPNGSYLNLAPSDLSSTNNSYVSFLFPDNNSFRLGTEYDGHLGVGIYRDLQFGRYSGAPYMTIKDGGNVGIGTTAPGTNKLAVEGTIAARKVVVTITSPFPDYVFKKDYRLPSLSSVGRYIRSNGHLPEMPAADSVQKNGLDLGGNQTLLVKKIEELTLYLLEQNRQLRSMQERINRLEKHLSKK